MLAGCDKYLDIKPKGKTLLTTVTDYDQWLNDPSLATGFAQPYCYYNYLGDNVDVPSITTPPTQTAELMYTWAPQISTDLSSAPFFWGEHYAKINQYNTVLLGIDEATNGTTAQKQSLKAEALLGRALEYFYLVNEYGKPYDSATAGKDPAVPWVISNDVTQVVPARSTVAEIHDHIIQDIKNAIPYLPLDNSANRLRGSVAAGYSILARIYLYARDYADARKYAELCLANTRAVMIDYNGTLPSSAVLGVQPDVIYGRNVLGYITATLDFMRTFEAPDLRPKKLYSSSDSYTYTKRGGTIFIPSSITPILQYLNTGTSLPEIKLIVAECAARSGDLTTALQQLDEVRKCRYATATYVKFQSTDKETVFQEVLKERAH
ncbi:MAG: RagB/SusD family nutrient uptake outer membrane protein, partial [Bacteroidetes bacterium]|nr:RagB/SusD family nutrient uptake outer membrane protein [Bacteroidota bacterium]